jgi:hypothetical protein
VLGLGETGARRFADLADLCRRVRWLGKPRRPLLWELGALRYEAKVDLVSWAARKIGGLGRFDITRAD